METAHKINYQAMLTWSRKKRKRVVVNDFTFTHFYITTPSDSDLDVVFGNL